MEKLKWNKNVLRIGMPILLIVDIAFFLATVTKILKGAWVPLLIGLLITYVMWVWRKGQKSLELAVREQVITWADVESNIATGTIAIIPGTGIYLSTTVTKVPQALAAQLKNLHSCPANILIVTVIQGDVPVVSANPMLKEVNSRVRQLYIWVGFNQDVNIQRSIIDFVMSKEKESTCTYYLADRKFVESSHGALSGLTEKVFAILHRNSATASTYFGLPESRVITLGIQMDL